MRKRRPTETTNISSDNDALLDAGLELERRLYDSAVASLDLTFTKESVVATFLTSGAIVGVAAAIQAIATISEKGMNFTPWVIGGAIVFLLGMCILSLTFPKFVNLLQGRKLQDLTSAESFLNGDPQNGHGPPSTVTDVKLQLMAEYQAARTNYMALVDARMAVLDHCLKGLGLGTLLIFAGTIFIIADTINSGFAIKEPDSEIKAETSKVPATNNNFLYTSDMAKENPKPTVKLPAPGPGTTMTKGGGGNGTVKK